MANANIALVQLANTFDNWRVTTNDIANSVNELRNGNYYKDGGNFRIADGVLDITKTSGTVLSVGADALVSGTLTVSNNSIVEKDVTIKGNNILLTGNTNLVNVANTLSTNNLIVRANARIANMLGTTNAESLNVVSLTVQNPISAPADSDASQYRLRVSQTTRGSGSFGVFQGVANGNAWLTFSSTENVWRATSNDATLVPSGGYYTILTTQNVSDSVTTSSSVNAASLTAVKTAYDRGTAAYNQANSAYGRANDAYAIATGGASAAAAYIQANLAYDQANTVYGFTNASYTQANTARNTANLAYGTANVAGIIAGSAYGQANVAYAQANSAYGQANSAYSTANSAANTTRVSANSGSSLSAKQLNFINTSTVTVAVTQHGSDSTNANIAFTVIGGGGGSGSVTSVATGFGLSGGPITSTGTISANVADTAIYGVTKLVDSISDSSTTLAATSGSVKKAYDFAQANALNAYAQANSATSSASAAQSTAQNAYGQANTSRTTANSAYSQANTAQTTAQNAYAQANASLHHVTSGYNSGNVTVSSTAPTNKATGDVWMDISTNYSATQNGWMTMPNGITIQWGQTNIPGDSIMNVAFPKAFTSWSVVTLTGGPSTKTDATQNNPHCYGSNTTHLFALNARGVSVPIFWHAIGV